MTTGTPSSHLRSQIASSISRPFGFERGTLNFVPTYTACAASISMIMMPGPAAALNATLKSMPATSAYTRIGSDGGSRRPSDPPVVTSPSAYSCG
jgi:hypothetical protein